MDYKRMPWYFRILGFYYLYQLQVIDNPVADDDGSWLYHVKLIGYQLRWIGIKLKTYDIPQD